MANLEDIELIATLAEPCGPREASSAFYQRFAVESILPMV
jgi:hypothetical protein